MEVVIFVFGYDRLVCVRLIVLMKKVGENIYIYINICLNVIESY